MDKTLSQDNELVRVSHNIIQLRDRMETLVEELERRASSTMQLAHRISSPLRAIAGLPQRVKNIALRRPRAFALICVGAVGLGVLLFAAFSRPKRSFSIFGR